MKILEDGASEVSSNIDLVNEILSNNSLDKVKGNENLELRIRRNDIDNVKPPFIMCGTGHKNNNGNSMNIIDTMAEMTKPELFLFRMITDRMNLTTMIGTTLSKSLTDSQKQQIKTGYKRLRTKNIIKRVRREHYMVNPDLIIPPEDYPRLKIIFKELQ
jgi:hypothetical protein